MKSVHVKRLLKLAEHLERGKLGHKKFNFEVVNASKTSSAFLACDTTGVKPYSCGYAGCAIGECPVAFPGLWKFNVEALPALRGRSGKTILPAAEEFFGLGPEEGMHLFQSGDQSPERFGGVALGPTATRKQVAANIRAFIKKKQSTPTPTGEAK